MRTPGRKLPGVFLVCRACSTAWRWKSFTQPDGGEGFSEAQGRRREVGSEGSVEQNCGLMDKNRITRPTQPDERASDREVHSHQGLGWEIRRACREGGRTYLGRSPSCPGHRTERVVRLVIAAEKSADGIVGGKNFAEGLNAG